MILGKFLLYFFGDAQYHQLYYANLKKGFFDQHNRPKNPLICVGFKYLST